MDNLKAMKLEAEEIAESLKRIANKVGEIPISKAISIIESRIDFYNDELGRYERMDLRFIDGVEINLYCFKIKNNDATKIGITQSHPLKRLRGLYPHKKKWFYKNKGHFVGDIEYLFWIPIKDKFEAIDIERIIIAEYHENAINGAEHFKFNDNEIKEIRSKFNGYGKIYELPVQNKVLAKTQIPEYC